MKTPEEIDRLELLAASYACDYRDSPNKTNGIPDSYLVYSIAYDAFLDGYKAAMDQFADADKVMCSTTMEEIKAVDTGEITPLTNLPTPAKWISVEEVIIDGKTYRLVES